MLKLNAKQIASLAKKGEPCRVPLGESLYFRVSDSGGTSFEVRYTVFGKRRVMTLDTPYPQLSLAEARIKAAEIKLQAKKNKDPLEQRKLENEKPFNQLRDLANDWLNEREKRIKTAHIYRRVYEKNIDPIIGQLPPESIRPIDVRTVIQKIANDGRPAIANDALNYLKHIFRHGIKLGELQSNPAEAFKYDDAGGIEKARTRALSAEELKTLFIEMHKQKDQITRENYLAVALLVCLACRKMELLAAKWAEYNFEQSYWIIPEERTKTGTSIKVPLTDPVIKWLEELKIRSAGSEYVFPSRRRSKREYMSHDTLNAAIAKLFKEEKLQIPHFTVHDLRRTARTLLASLKVPPHISERCLNHKLRGVEGVYDHYDYFDERLSALTQLSDLVSPLVNQ
ncbi:tyrosine-type recombinase/integrase [Aliiglaciecola sp. 2_MG-2023]|uniref:tyrosine-type recombinase/integrase n=1 Tax=unclassified Aliiglaciecola TaxID=2593648 RepID=UPI0026E2CD95|nr:MULTISPECIES: tyrosine-type recombinase/integrase [unclassified Aliiglaciecola]MDO6712860.1 tyrosine-type recombinase/integrase [Aliiglaciecola sp. 2_MG-2023]MDO6753955.1 tyrosine-type recombinase/integrase [Aliiglaciecola sp. 1_MG-2023]